MGAIFLAEGGIKGEGVLGHGNPVGKWVWQIHHIHSFSVLFYMSIHRQPWTNDDILIGTGPKIGNVFLKTGFFFVHRIAFVIFI